MDGLTRFPKQPAASPRLGGSPISSGTGYPWVDGDILYAADLNAAFLPITTGGTVTGPTKITANLPGSTFPAASNPTVFEVDLNTSGITDVYNICSIARISSGAASTTGSVGGSAQVAFLATSIKYIPSGGMPGGATQLQDQWAFLGNNYDASNSPSSIGGVVTSEFDTSANGRDDLGGRSGLQLIFGNTWGVGSPGPANPFYGPTPTTGGWPGEFQAGLIITTGDNCVLSRGIFFGARYGAALWDSRPALSLSGIIQATAGAGATTVHVSHVVTYMTWGTLNRAVVSASNPIPVTIGANTYSVTNAQFDAAGSGGVTTTLGTLTLASGIIGTDGAAGNPVTRASRTIWLGSGQQIGFDDAGDCYMFSLGTTLEIHTPAYVNVTGAFQISGAMNVGGNLQTFGNLMLGNQSFPSNAEQDFYSSGHSTADASIVVTGGTGTALVGTMAVSAASVQLTATSVQVGKVGSLSFLNFAYMPINAANDAAAATAGVPVSSVYRNGSVLMVRVA